MTDDPTKFLSATHLTTGYPMRGAEALMPPVRLDNAHRLCPGSVSIESASALMPPHALSVTKKSA
jgi:hypothetical protein